MRAGRLLSILLLLQVRGRLSARQLATEVEASVSTIQRDIDHLSAAGVPVRSFRGPEGGFELVDGWQTRLTGLTADEAGAVLLSGLGEPGSDLGLADVIGSARLKLLAALPVGGREAAERMSSRFHLDPAGWFRTTERLEHLTEVAAAVWEGERLWLRYESWSGVVERTVDALGLVLKAGVWYLVGGTAGTPRIYRVSSIQEVRSTGEHFERPDGFDLAGYWAGAARRFEAGVYHATAVLRVAPGAMAHLAELSPAMAHAAAGARESREPDGWSRVTIAVESIELAARQLLALGPDVEVVEPPALRRAIRSLARRIVATYAGGGRRTQSVHTRTSKPPRA